MDFARQLRQNPEPFSLIELNVLQRALHHFRCYIEGALATLAYMLDPSSKLDRMFGVLRTIADFGPLAVSSSEFSATSRTVVERVLASMDTTEGALCSLDEHNSSITCVAKVGLEALPPNVAIRIGGGVGNWGLLRRPLPVPPLGGLA